MKITYNVLIYFFINYDYNVMEYRKKKKIKQLDYRGYNPDHYNHSLNPKQDNK